MISSESRCFVSSNPLFYGVFSFYLFYSLDSLFNFISLLLYLPYLTLLIYLISLFLSTLYISASDIIYLDLFVTIRCKPINASFLRLSVIIQSRIYNIVFILCCTYFVYLSGCPSIKKWRLFVSQDFIIVNNLVVRARCPVPILDVGFGWNFGVSIDSSKTFRNWIVAKWIPRVYHHKSCGDGEDAYPQTREQCDKSYRNRECYHLSPKLDRVTVLIRNLSVDSGNSEFHGLLNKFHAISVPTTAYSR